MTERIVPVINHNVYGNKTPLAKVFPKSDLNTGTAIITLQEVHGEDLARIYGSDFRDRSSTQEILGREYPNPTASAIKRKKDFIFIAPDYFQENSMFDRYRIGQLFGVTIVPDSFTIQKSDSSRPGEKQPLVKAFGSNFNSYTKLDAFIDFLLCTGPIEAGVRSSQGWSPRTSSALAVPVIDTETGNKIDVFNFHLPAVAWAYERLKLFLQIMGQHFNINIQDHLQSIQKSFQEKSLKEALEKKKELQTLLQPFNLILGGDFNCLFKRESENFNSVLQNLGICSPFMGHPGTYGWGKGKKVDLIGTKGQVSIVPGSYKVLGYNNSDHKRIRMEALLHEPQTTPKTNRGHLKEISSIKLITPNSSGQQKQSDPDAELVSG